MEKSLKPMAMSSCVWLSHRSRMKAPLPPVAVEVDEDAGSYSQKRNQTAVIGTAASCDCCLLAALVPHQCLDWLTPRFPAGLPPRNPWYPPRPKRSVS